MEFQTFHTEDITGARFLITGGGGFIGSHLADYLIQHHAGKVRVLDNFSSGFRENLENIRAQPAFELIEGDIRDSETCREAFRDIDYVFHQAAMGSVPKSVEDPLTFHDVNVNGFLNVLQAAVNTGIKRFVYASSSSVYGDHPSVSKSEAQVGNLLSPYAVTKYSNELYAGVFYRNYGLSNTGLRYFNVFGPRQNPEGDYAAVIPKFILRLIKGESPEIYGDGEQTRDFTYISNVIQANMSAFEAQKMHKFSDVYNIGCGVTTNLNALLDIMEDILDIRMEPVYRPNRQGDIRESLADISKARDMLGYNPDTEIREGLANTINWFETHY